ncbi:MAG TPA: hypothetical protein VFU26_00430 [Gaiellaceae bacterium]|nr:hypothetical protein [Gaiellaceae bacterium]
MGVLVATVARAPDPADGGRPTVRTLHVVKNWRSAPKTQFVRARDCVQRPRSCVNGIGGQELVYLLKGKMPTRSTTTALVLTDTNCAADPNGISHCHNVLRLASGSMMTVRHDHSMGNDPCLVPGERVRVRPLR